MGTLEMVEPTGRPTLFLVYDAADLDVTDDDLERAALAVRSLAGLREALAFTPLTPGEQPFAKDGRGPALALQLDFASLGDLEAALDAAGPLAGLVRPGGLTSLAGAGVSWQAMSGRRFPTPDPVFRLPPGCAPCTFLVEYPARCENPDAWLDHYDAHHPPIMVRFPAIRAVETFRPISTRGRLPCALSQAMQRNKVVFDTSEALVAALASPVMDEMRADSAGFAAVPIRPTHFVMRTWSWVGG